MSLDLGKLQNVKRRGGAISARCPACAEGGHDRQGNHLFIAPDGRYGCVLYPGEAGRTHRQKIFELVGIGSYESPARAAVISVKGKSIKPPEVIESNILGRLGRWQQNPVKPEN